MSILTSSCSRYGDPMGTLTDVPSPHTGLGQQGSTQAMKSLNTWR